MYQTEELAFELFIIAAIPVGLIKTLVLTFDVSISRQTGDEITSIYDLIKYYVLACVCALCSIECEMNISTRSLACKMDNRNSTHTHTHIQCNNVWLCERKWEVGSVKCEESDEHRGDVR